MKLRDNVLVLQDSEDCDLLFAMIELLLIEKAQFLKTSTIEELNSLLRDLEKVYFVE